MGNAFWKDLEKYQPARLENLTLDVLKKYLPDQMISDPLRNKIHKAEYRCAMCKEIKIGQVYPVLRPCSGRYYSIHSSAHDTMSPVYIGSIIHGFIQNINISDIWDQPIIPFIFKCCSFQCMRSAKEVKSNTDF